MSKPRSSSNVHDPRSPITHQIRITPHLGTRTSRPFGGSHPSAWRLAPESSSWLTSSVANWLHLRGQGTHPDRPLCHEHDRRAVPDGNFIFLAGHSKWRNQDDASKPRDSVRFFGTRSAAGGRGDASGQSKGSHAPQSYPRIIPPTEEPLLNRSRLPVSCARKAVFFLFQRRELRRVTVPS